MKQHIHHNYFLHMVNGVMKAPKTPQYMIIIEPPPITKKNYKLKHKDFLPALNGWPHNETRSLPGQGLRKTKGKWFVRPLYHWCESRSPLVLRKQKSSRDQFQCMRGNRFEIAKILHLANLLWISSNIIVNFKHYFHYPLSVTWILTLHEKLNLISPGYWPWAWRRPPHTGRKALVVRPSPDT